MRSPMAALALGYTLLAIAEARADEAPPPPSIAQDAGEVQVPTPPSVPQAQPEPEPVQPAALRPARPRCAPLPPGAPLGVDAAAVQASALGLEQRGDLDAAGKLWQRLIAKSSGETRIFQERRLNALAQVELAWSDLQAGRAKEAAVKLQSAWFDLQAQAKAPLSLPAPVPAAVALLRAGGKVAQGQAEQGHPWWQSRLETGQVKGVRPVAERMFGGVEDEEPVATAGLSDGGAVVLAAVDLGAAGLKLRAWGLDVTGRQRWMLTWASQGQGGNLDVPVTVLALPGGQWLSGGCVEKAGRQIPWLLRGDSQGKVLADMQLPGQGQVEALLALPGQTVLATVRSDQGLRVVQVTAAGQVSWSAQVQGADGQLRWGPKGQVLVGSVPLQRLKPAAGQWQVEAIPLKDIKGLKKLLGKPPALRLAAVTSGVHVQGGKGALQVSGAGPWRLAELVDRQWLLVGAVAQGGCHRDVVVLRLAVGK